MAKLVIRDDDTSYFTQPQELEKCYANIWHQGPISLAVVPFSVKSYHAGNSDKFYQDKAEKPIANNSNIVLFLKELLKKNRAYIMLHGYNHLYQVHENKDGTKTFRGEFAYKENPAKWIKIGKEYLEDIFSQKIKWFIPPSNDISYSSIQACDKLGLSIPDVYGFKKRLLTPDGFKNAVKNYYYRYVHPLYPRRVKVQPIFRFNNHLEVPCTAFTKSQNYDFIKRCKKMNRFVIATHYWEVNEFSFIKQHMKTMIKLYGSIHSMEAML